MTEQTKKRNPNRRNHRTHHHGDPMNHVNHPLSIETPVISVRPVVVPVSGRDEDLHIRVSAPTTGNNLPIIVFSHGYGSSLDGYAPLVDYWAAHGFVVLQPTHLDSRSLKITNDDPRFANIWRIRVDDLRSVVDYLDVVEQAVPGLDGRLDRNRIAAVGHSWGGQSVSMLLGARVLDAQGVAGQDLSDARIMAGVLLSTTGTGGSDLTTFAAEHFAFMNPDFDTMTTPTLVIAGDHDQSQLTTRGPDWFTDPYRLSPAPKSLLTLFGAEHGLGGIVGYNATETTDESPERVALIQQVTVAYLNHTLGLEQSKWVEQQQQLDNGSSPLGRLDSR
jgi:dipeptidyl aminopeptidase/acylaminoacyl peptidase